MAVTNLNAANITVGTINGAQITNGAITNSKIGVDAVDNTKIADGAVKNENIFAATITGDKLVVDAITAREIAALTITATEIAANTITAAKMTVGTITAASGIIADAAITNAKIASLDAGKITTGILNAITITGGTITGTTIKTSSDTTRLEMSGTSFKGYASGIKRLELLTDKLNFTDSANKFTGSIQAIPETDLALSRLDINASDMIKILSEVDADNFVQFSMNRPYSVTDFTSGGSIYMYVNSLSPTYGALGGTSFEVHPNGVIVEHSDYSGTGVKGNFDLYGIDLNVQSGNINIPLGTLTIGTGESRAGITMNGGLAVGYGSAIDTIQGGRRSIQISTDNNYGGTFDNHSGFMIYSTMVTGWGYADLNFCQASGWGTYNAPMITFGRGGSIEMNGGSSGGYAVRHIDTAAGARPCMINGRTVI